MLLQFSVSNFCALRDLATLDMGAGNYDKSLPECLLSPELPGLKGRKWLKGAALYGANASGKSTVLEAMKALSEWVRLSAKTTDPSEFIPYVEGFALDSETGQEPTAFGAVFVAKDGVRYEYRAVATRQRVVHESLRAWPKGKEQLWFERNWDEGADAFRFEPEYSTGLPRTPELEKRTLPNMLYLSKCMAENRGEIEAAYQWLANGIRFINLGRNPDISGAFTAMQMIDGDASFRKRIVELLRRGDLGITDAKVLRREVAVEELLQSDHLPGIFSGAMKGEGSGVFLMPQMLHAGKAGKALPLSWNTESTGTQRIFDLAGPWLETLNQGYTIYLDELETSLHPIIVRELLKMVFSERGNPNGAQIIFTTHNPLLLDGSLLRRDQVWFTEKDREGAAHLYPLTEYQPRSDESLIRGYLAGRYGGIPFIPEGLI